MFNRIEGSAPSGLQIEDKPLEYFDNPGLGVAADISGSSLPIISPVVESVVKPVAKRVANIFGGEQAIEEPKVVISEFNPENGEEIPIPTDDIKPIAKPKDDPNKYNPPYEHFDDGVQQALVNLALKHKYDQRHSDNPTVGAVGSVLLHNNGEAPVAEVAAITELSEDFVRGFDVLTGVFEVFPHPETGEDIIRSDYYSGLKVIEKDGWVVAVPVEQLSAAD